MEFSTSFITVSFIFLFACVMLPVLYYIYYMYKRRLNHIPMLAGILCFLLFGYLLMSFLLANALPESLADQIGKAPYALLRTLVIALCEAGGMYLVLRLLHGQYGSTVTPISFGLGYTLVNMLLIGGINGFLRLSQAMAVNENGLESVLETVDPGQQEALKEALTELAELPLSSYIMEFGEFICFFLLSIALARILWYAIEDGKRPASNVCLLLGLGMRFLAEIAYYFAGRSENYVLFEVLYYLVTALTVALAVLLHLRYDDAEKVSAGPLNRRLL